MRPARGVDDSGSADVIVGPGKFTSWRLRRGADSNGQGRALAVGLHLNRRLRCQGIHDLDAVIVALKSWTTALLSWTSFTPNFVPKSPPAISLATDTTLLADDRRRGRVDFR